MVLLWRDPEGGKVTSVHSVTGSQQSSEMAMLQKTISQKDDEIAQLKNEISLLKEVTLKNTCSNDFGRALIYRIFSTRV